MKKEVYEELPLNEKADYLWENGLFVESTVYYNSRVSLYTLHDYFVEVFYDVAYNKIIRIDLCHLPELNKYLSKIDLPKSLNE